MWPARQCALHQGVSRSPGWHDPRWQGNQLDNRQTVGRLQVPQPAATNYQPLDIKRKQKSRQNEGTDKTKARQMKTKTTVALSLAHRSVLQPFVASYRLRTLTLREHQHFPTWQMKLSNTADWEQAPPEGKAPRGDCGFTIDETEHSRLKVPWYPCREKPSPLNRHVFMTLDAWLTASLISFSYTSGLCVTFNAWTERGTFM